MPQKVFKMIRNLKKGDKIHVLKKMENGWWIGAINDQIGFFPFNFVNII